MSLAAEFWTFCSFSMSCLGQPKKMRSFNSVSCWFHVFSSEVLGSSLYPVLHSNKEFGERERKKLSQYTDIRKISNIKWIRNVEWLQIHISADRYTLTVVVLGMW